MNNDFILLTDRAKPSPDALGRLIGVAVASGLQLPPSRSDENPIWWLDFLPEHEIIELILATGGGMWRIDISRIDDDDNDTINGLIDALSVMCADEFCKLHPDLARRRDAHSIAEGMIRDVVMRAWVCECGPRAWKPNITLSKLIRAAREIYPDVRSVLAA
ncbi:hypothetical protein [Acidomonas methanolica]|uniref:Uncharacterized protein n=1 Tax=Acidomonas methanolica NBRC 104435 TaxID=1231351 RepID=A0A023D5Z0_ACIMT|nr:hypothetical protein [Acidomonas methanolica]TCS25733.1 hypothetical protein EDC31_11613 [Acidomonas methanolica]GAJ29583.1 hypothetical protein Amme_068_016 [Acidomonas methanolica NBRC 104435]GBQ54784.1 hypothetical protein AA0498_2170 [Acidomonas methanolica]GEK99343.1 hypothetical protein AME01nite_18420 [Acidomonas methanolica NBRC 104435]